MFSKYNISINIGDNIWIYNTFKKSIIKLSQQEYDQILNGDIEKISSELHKSLIQKGIVFFGENESEVLLKEYEKCVEDLKLELMIISSTACNFACGYCYENLVPKSIDKKFEIVLLKYLEKNIRNFKSLFLEWFGGEPLIEKKYVISISKEVKKLCQENHISFLSSITTNGYFLDYSTFSELLSANVIYYQVTIDGDKDWHDKYRPLVNGAGTYEKIMSNLLDIKKKSPVNKYFRLTIRNNICKENIESCGKFAKIFEKNFGNDKRFDIFQFPISNWGGKKIEGLKNNLFHKKDILSSNSNFAFE